MRLVSSGVSNTQDEVTSQLSTISMLYGKLYS